jgi:hydroxybutyrate-dimer hydrolase
VYDDSVGGALLDLQGISPSTGVADFALDGAICHRNLAVGRDILTGKPLRGEPRELSKRVREGIEDVQLEAKLRGKPVILVHGRADALVPPNHSTRAYFGATQLHGDHRHGVRYIEVTNAQHFDAFLPGAPFAGYDTRFVPLHVYLIRALDWMYDHLTHHKPLPPSQVVRTVPRGGDPGAAPAITPANVPPILEHPAEADRIVMQGRTLVIPE